MQLTAAFANQGCGVRHYIQDLLAPSSIKARRCDWCFDVFYWDVINDRNWNGRKVAASCFYRIYLYTFKMFCIRCWWFYIKHILKWKSPLSYTLIPGWCTTFIYLCRPLQCIAFTYFCCFISYGWLGMNILRAAYETDSGIMLMCAMVMSLEWIYVYKNVIFFPPINICGLINAGNSNEKPTNSICLVCIIQAYP